MCAELVFKISVNWHKSYMWGANPRAEVWASLTGVRGDYTNGSNSTSNCSFFNKATSAFIHTILLA